MSTSTLRTTGHTADTSRTARPTLRVVSPQPAADRLGTLGERLRETLRTWRERARSRRHLRRAIQLYAVTGGSSWQDLGRTRADLSAEARKPFWRA